MSKPTPSINLYCDEDLDSYFVEKLAIYTANVEKSVAVLMMKFNWNYSYASKFFIQKIESRPTSRHQLETGKYIARVGLFRCQFVEQKDSTGRYIPTCSFCGGLSMKKLHRRFGKKAKWYCPARTIYTWSNKEKLE